MCFFFTSNSSEAANTCFVVCVSQNTALVHGRTLGLQLMRSSRSRRRRRRRRRKRGRGRGKGRGSKRERRRGDRRGEEEEEEKHWGYCQIHE